MILCASRIPDETSQMYVLVLATEIYSPVLSFAGGFDYLPA